MDGQKCAYGRQTDIILTKYRLDVGMETVHKLNALKYCQPFIMRA